MPVRCIDSVDIVLACCFGNQICCSVLSHPCYSLLLTLRNDVVAAESRIKYFSVASANPFWRCFLQTELI